MYNIGNYKIYRKAIGKGSFSKIYRGINDNHDDIAVKIIKKKKINEKLVSREITLLKTVAHINIVKLIDVFVSENKYYLILEYCHNGDLKQFVKNKCLDEADILNFMTQIKNGLEYLHKNNITHRDLKPQNILVTENNILKISDFGFAKFHTENLSQTMCGSPLYMAPEILTYKNYTDLADLWSVGVIMYELFFNKTPVNGKNIYDLVRNIKKYNFSVINNNISKQALILLDGLLKIHPKNRLSWKNFFNHSWFNLKIEMKNKNMKKNDDLIFEIDGCESENSYSSNCSTGNNSNGNNNSNRNNYTDDKSDIDNSYNVLCSKNKFELDDEYLNIESSLIENIVDKNYIIISSSPSKYTQKFPKSLPKNNFRNLIKSLRSSLSFIFNPKSI